MRLKSYCNLNVLGLIVPIQVFFLDVVIVKPFNERTEKFNPLNVPVSISFNSLFLLI